MYVRPPKDASEADLMSRNGHQDRFAGAFELVDFELK